MGDERKGVLTKRSSPVVSKANEAMRSAMAANEERRLWAKRWAEAEAAEAASWPTSESSCLSSTHEAESLHMPELRTRLL